MSYQWLLAFFYVFKDKIEEQLYLQNKYKRIYKWQQLTSAEPLSNKKHTDLIVLKNKDVFDSFWKKCLILGRIPLKDEFQQSEKIKELIGSHKKNFLCDP